MITLRYVKWLESVLWITLCQTRLLPRLCLLQMARTDYGEIWCPQNTILREITESVAERGESLLLLTLMSARAFLWALSCSPHHGCSSEDAEAKVDEVVCERLQASFDGGLRSMTNRL